MSRRNPIIGSNTKKRLIHCDLMVWEDTRKTIDGDGILEIGTKPPSPSWDIKWRVFYHWGTLKKGSLCWKYVVKGFKLKRLLLSLSKFVRIFLICGPRTYGQLCIRKVKATYASPSPHTHGSWQKPIPSYFEHSFHLRHSKGSYYWKNTCCIAYKTYAMEN